MAPPSPKKIFAIGDVHGCASELRMLLNKLPLTEESVVVFLGDYVDRGPNSKQVIETVLELKEQCQVVALKGNHEALFLSFLQDPSSEAAGMFIYNGGSATLHSYATPEGEYRIPRSHRDFLENLDLYYETDDFFFVHAGVPRVPIAQVDREKHAHDFLWSRGPFLRSTYRWEKLIIHGHTPVKAVDVRANRINVDTACVFDRTLTALELPERRIHSVKRQARARHVYLRDPGDRRDAVRFSGALPVYVYRGDESHQFETVDYSEFGMYMRDITSSEKDVIDPGSDIIGQIGSQDHTLVDFHGECLRVERRDDGVFYAVRLHHVGEMQR
jgi:serine/threonine protein phosphatase 1